MAERDTNAIQAALIRVFRTHCIDVREKGGAIVADIQNEDPFTFAQMMQLPNIFGTERFDFDHFEECRFGGSDVTPADFDSGLRIVARYEREAHRG